MDVFRKLFVDRTGGTAIEYALIAGLISTAALTAFYTLGNEVQLTYDTMLERLQTSNTAN